MAEPPPKEEKKKVAQGSAYVYSSVKKNHWYSVGLLNFRKEHPEADKGQVMLYVLLAMVVLAGFGTALVGWRVAAPPHVITEQCPPPAYLSGGGCYRTVVVLVGTSTSTETFTTGGPVAQSTVTTTVGGG